MITTQTNAICLNRTSGAADSSYAASGTILLNGMPIVKAPGSTLTITPAIGAALAKITGTAVRVDEAGVNIVDGAINWLLPAGAPGQGHSIANVGLAPAGIDLLGLHAEGRIAFALGTDGDGTPYVRVGAYLAIPGFTLSEAATSPGVTGKISFRIDARGVHFDAVKMQVDHAKLHDLDVNNVCLSYVAAGQTGDQCDQFDDPAGQPFLKVCATDTTTNRWNGTMDITLPTKGDAGFAFSGELQGGTLGNIAAKAEFGHTVPLVEGVYLKSIAAGLCLKPPPFKLRGQAVISVIPAGSKDAIEVDGSFLYVDAANGAPWSITLQGGLSMFDHHLADGTVSLDGNNALSVGFHARLQLPSDDVDAASVDGQVNGWLQGSTFDIEGSVSVCLLDVACIDGNALVSSAGVSACASLGTVYYPIVTFSGGIPDFSYGSYEVKTGFGYQWHGSVDVMGDSCDVGPWRPAGGPAAASAAAVRAGVLGPAGVGGGAVGSGVLGPGAVRAGVLRAASAPYELRIKAGTIPSRASAPARGGGSSGRDGGDRTRRNPARGVGAAGGVTADREVPDRPEPQDGTTAFELLKPAPGVWSITPALGSTVRCPSTRLRSSCRRPSAAGCATTRRATTSTTPSPRRRVPCSASSSITGAWLRPWGRASGDLSAGGAPADGAEREREGGLRDARLRAGRRARRRAGDRCPDHPPRNAAEHLQGGRVRRTGAPPSGSGPGAPAHRTARRTILAWAGARLATRYEVAATSTEGYQRLS